LGTAPANDAPSSNGDQDYFMSLTVAFCEQYMISVATVVALAPTQWCALHAPRVCDRAHLTPEEMGS